MTRSILLLSGVFAAATLISPRAGLAAPPQGSWTRSALPGVVVREHCFGGRAEERSRALQSQGYVGSNGLGSRGTALGGAGRGGGVSQPTTRSAPQPSAAPPPRAKRAPAADAVGFGGGGASSSGAVAVSADEAEAEPFAPPSGSPAYDRPAGPRVDWGGVTYLSNDDSMSLASAQRLTWALEHGQRIPLEHIRAHELLNWVHFDTVAPTGSDVFGVYASAERTAQDELALTLTLRAATPARPATDLTLLVDRSGSMGAEGRMDYTRRALTRISEQVQPGDRVDLVVFDQEVCTPLENWVAGRDDPALLRRVIDSIQDRGSTDLDAGLREAYRLARSHGTDAGRSGRVMVFTDAELNTGSVDPDLVTEIGRALDESGIRLTGVGVGSSFRDDVLNQLTEKGKGAYVFLGSERMVDRLFGEGFDSLVHTIAHDLQVALDLPDSLGMKTFHGEEASTRAEDVQPTHVHAGAVQTYFQDLSIRDGRPLDRDPLTLSLTFTDPASGQRRTQRVQTTVGKALAASPHNVDKAQALVAWAEVLTAQAMGLDACGTPLRSFLAARDQVGSDAEVAYLSGLLTPYCSLERRPEPPAPATSHRTRVRVDSDQPIDAVAMSCGGATEQVPLAAGTSIASFQTTAGSCRVTLFGTVPMVASLQVPPTGGDVRCTLRSGRLVCQ